MRIIGVVFILLSACACLTPAQKKQINAAVWLNNGPIPVEICNANPQLYLRGQYRILSNGKKEFISWCDPNIVSWLSMYKDDFDKIMNSEMQNPEGEQSE